MSTLEDIYYSKNIYYSKDISEDYDEDSEECLSKYQEINLKYTSIKEKQITEIINLFDTDEKKSIKDIIKLNIDTYLTEKISMDKYKFTFIDSSTKKEIEYIYELQEFVYDEILQIYKYEQIKDNDIIDIGMYIIYDIIQKKYKINEFELEKFKDFGDFVIHKYLSSPKNNEFDVNDFNIFLENIRAKQTKNIISEIIDNPKYNRDGARYINKINTTDLFFYSAYQYPVNMQNKDLFWCTPDFQQALLHIFDLHRNICKVIKPIIYRFKINSKKNIYVLSSKDKQNNKIFNFLLDSLKKKITDYYSQPEFNNYINIFEIQNNIRILYVIEALNRIVNDDNYIISGYENKYDQNEYAFINIKTDLVNISESKILRFAYFFPPTGTFIYDFINKNLYLKETGNIIGIKMYEETPDKSGMGCFLNFYVYYTSFDNLDYILRYTCNDYNNYIYYIKEPYININLKIYYNIITKLFTKEIFDSFNLFFTSKKSYLLDGPFKKQIIESYDMIILKTIIQIILENKEAKTYKNEYRKITITNIDKIKEEFTTLKYDEYFEVSSYNEYLVSKTDLLNKLYELINNYISKKKEEAYISNLKQVLKQYIYFIIELFFMFYLNKIKPEAVKQPPQKINIEDSETINSIILNNNVNLISDYTTFISDPNINTYIDNLQDIIDKNIGKTDLYGGHKYYKKYLKYKEKYLKLKNK
jgi:hypothetical protein